MSYYFIGIGGSGAKVLESLTHLCAAGLLPNVRHQEKLYVMSVDPDIGNGNLKRSSAALNNLTAFDAEALGEDTPLLKTEAEILTPFPWSPTEHDKKLDDILAYQSHLGTPLGDLYETLYTKDERGQLLNEGFRGRPSIGAAVLAQKAALFSSGEGWEDHAEAPWSKLAHQVKLDASSGRVAKIFLAGSVFGGTGAAGMPTVAKLLRQEFRSDCERGKVVIGGALILPYFSFTHQQTAEDEIYASSENFLTNTKAALKYYAQEYKKARVYDAMYFIGDNVLSPVQTFSVGSSSQQNDAHIVDFYGAMAALDFFASRDGHYKECSYITHAEENTFHWTDFPNIVEDSGSEASFKERFAHFTRFVFAYVHLVKPVLHALASGKEKGYKYPWYLDYFKDAVDVSSMAVKNFEEYAESYVRWLGQLESSETNRAVQFVRRDAFVPGEKPGEPARIDAGRFAQCIYEEESDVTMHEVFARLAEHPEKDPDGAKDFGRFLRALYDCCENTKH